MAAQTVRHNQAFVAPERNGGIVELHAISKLTANAPRNCHKQHTVPSARHTVIRGKSHSGDLANALGYLKSGRLCSLTPWPKARQSSKRLMLGAIRVADFRIAHHGVPAPLYFGVSFLLPHQQISSIFSFRRSATTFWHAVRLGVPVAVCVAGVGPPWGDGPLIWFWHIV